MSHWSSGLPVCFPSQGPRFKSPGGYLCETGILLLALSHNIGDPDVIDHHCSLVWGGLHPKLSLGPHADNVIIPLDLTQLFCPGFTLAAGPPSSFTTDGVSCWGRALWRACNLASFSPCLTGPVDYLFASHHKRPRFKSSGGYLCETRILLLGLSRYNPILIFPIPLSHRLESSSNGDMKFETLHVIALIRKWHYKFLVLLELAPWYVTGDPCCAIGTIAPYFFPT